MLVDRKSLMRLAGRLPVFPRCAAEVIRTARDGCLTSEQLISLTRMDQVLAASVIHAANSAAYTWSGSISTIEHAVLFLGEIRGTQVLVSAALKPILGVVGHQKLWDHSIDVAHVAQRLALKTRAFPESEAYVLGLLHDVGELLLRLVPAANRERLEALIAEGHPKRDAEMVACGASHSQAGADLLRYWRLPDAYAAAVEHHHEPEACRDAGSALLYLAEHWTDSGGDELSNDRLNYSMELLGISSLPATMNPATETAARPAQERKRAM